MGGEGAQDGASRWRGGRAATRTRRVCDVVSPFGRGAPYEVAASHGPLARRPFRVRDMAPKPPLDAAAKVASAGAAPGRSLLRFAWWVAAGLSLAAALVHPHLASAFNGSRLVPSESVLALLFGILVGLAPGIQALLGGSLKRVSKQAIPIAIVAIGFSLDLGPLVKSGQIGISLVLVLVAMSVAFAASMLFGRLLGLDPRASMLLGAGTAVCGNSAIMAVAPTVKADDRDLGLAIGVINLLGVLMLFVLPPVATSAGIVGEEGGALAGLTVHAVPQAIATGEAFGPTALEFATLFKLLRVAMLVPFVVILALALSRVRKGSVERKGAALPWFVVLFVVAAAVRSFGLVGQEITLGADTEPLWYWLKKGGKFLLAVALAAIGAGLDLRTLLRVGPRVLVAGALAVATMVAVMIPLVGWLL